jgi:hypothetical protein
MSWLLVFTFTFQGQSGDVPVGILVDENTCIVAGKGMEFVLEGSNPDLDVSWTCVAPAGEARA